MMAILVVSRHRDLLLANLWRFSLHVISDDYDSRNVQGTAPLRRKKGRIRDGLHIMIATDL